MKARHRKHREAGGVAEYQKDLSEDVPSYTADAEHIVKAAKGRKHGGRSKKHVAMHGMSAKHHAGRKPRKSGGRAGSNMNPLSSAHAGTPAKGRSVKQID